MMYEIESSCTDPYTNLALEQYIFDRLDHRHSYFMLWQNDNAVIIGKNQNTAAEINASYIKERQITVARRLSGGGAVYHDLGNLNFTFIADAKGGEAFDFVRFCRPIRNALADMGVEVEISGRNDMTIAGKKLSGNSQYIKRGRIMHHGTIMYDSNLSVLAQALKVPNDKLKSKGIPSIQSRVTNVKPFMAQDVGIEAFREALRRYMIQETGMERYVLSAQDWSEIQRLRTVRYSTWEWNYGASPSYQHHKARRFPGCGRIEVCMNVREGILEQLAFYGDYFGNEVTDQLAAQLTGCRLNEADLRERLKAIDVSQYFANLGKNAFIELLLQ